MIPIYEMGNRFIISKKNCIKGRLEFSTGEAGNLRSYPLEKDKDYTFQTPKIIETSHVKFVPTFVKIITTEKLDSITIEVF